MSFEWDDPKAQRNKAKHGVSFEEAEIVFDDPLAVIFDDEWHSTNETREIIIGYSNQYRILLICFTEGNGRVRLISAPEATRQERADYETNTHLSLSSTRR